VIAMPITNAADSMKPCILVMRWPRPAMIPDRMGIMGSMQGVNDSSNPNPKKLITSSQKPPRNSSATRESSDCRTGAANEEDGSAPPREDSVPNAASLSSAFCSCGT
jgi:hypothetical protein